MLKFEVNARGSTKAIAVSQCGKFVRRIKHSETEADDATPISDEKAKAIFKSMSRHGS